ASADNQLSYTIEIETNKMNLKKNEYDQKSKTAEIEKLEKATVNTEVRSDIDGIIQKIDTSKLNTGDDSGVSDSLEDDSSYGTSDNSNSAFITILSTGAYRVKGYVNELNINNVVTGSSVIIRSRVDESQTWTGMMGSVDMENSSQSSDDSSYYGGSSDSNSGSSSYPFYVELDSSDGLMLGQHVYIESNDGQLDKKEGLWLSDYFIADVDTENPYVWVANDKNRLVKQSVTLGKYDDSLMEYEILDGVTEDSLIAFPAASLEEGMKTVKGTGEQTMESMFETSDTEENYTDDGTVYEDDGAVISDDGSEVIEATDVDESEMGTGTGDDNFDDMVIEIDDTMPDVIEETTSEETTADDTTEIIIDDAFTDDITVIGDDLQPVE
ncbi:MAG: efflux RND transporter periplasmic adaptor subunit, partial [Eubacteriales bacterium]|nr:efflux RND transporter periplasmic adaptor subunit [Eubacteriales bacterium]